MNVVIMGCGRVGARVASILDHNGHTVTVIDTDARAFRRLAGDFSGDTIIGTGTDEDGGGVKMPSEPVVVLDS